MAQITKERAITLLMQLIDTCDEVRKSLGEPLPLVKLWDRISVERLQADVVAVVAHIFGERSRQLADIRKRNLSFNVSFAETADENLLSLRAALESLVFEISTFWDDQTPADLISAVKEAATASKASDSPVNYDRSKLLWNITTYFDMSEIENICFLMGVNHEAIRGEEITSKARELILYCERNQRIGELVEVCKKLRPNASWES